MNSVLMLHVRQSQICSFTERFLHVFVTSRAPPPKVQTSQTEMSEGACDPRQPLLFVFDELKGGDWGGVLMLLQAKRIFVNRCYAVCVESACT
jgi:hypothetical protein